MVTQKRHQNIYYTSIVERLRVVSCGNSSYPTVVVEPVYGYQILPLTAKAV